mgnify:CR=1 FL=1
MYYLVVVKEFQFHHKTRSTPDMTWFQKMSNLSSVDHLCSCANKIVFTCGNDLALHQISFRFWELFEMENKTLN